MMETYTTQTTYDKNLWLQGLREQALKEDQERQKSQPQASYFEKILQRAWLQMVLQGWQRLFDPAPQQQGQLTTKPQESYFERAPILKTGLSKDDLSHEEIHSWKKEEIEQQAFPGKAQDQEEGLPIYPVKVRHQWRQSKFFRPLEVFGRRPKKAQLEHESFPKGEGNLWTQEGRENDHQSLGSLLNSMRWEKQILDRHLQPHSRDLKKLKGVKEPQEAIFVHNRQQLSKSMRQREEYFGKGLRNQEKRRSLRNVLPLKVKESKIFQLFKRIAKIFYFSTPPIAYITRRSLGC